LPAVFDRERRPWVLADNAAADEVSTVIERCPSGALQYRRLDGAPNEPTGSVTAVTPVENGPLALRGDLVVRRSDGTHERFPRVALCRCGQSKNKPFCDNSHLEAGFQATGATPAELLPNVPRRPTR
jgi:CDGSH-type Zn-finger protein